MAEPWRLLIQADGLVSWMQREHRGDLLLLDCRHVLTDPEAGPRAYRESHVPDAVHAHVDHDLSGPGGPKTGRHPLPSADRFRDRVESWGITPNTQVVAYDDQGGAFAARAWWLLRYFGHERVAVLDGGLPAYEKAGGEWTEAVPERSRATRPLRPGGMPVLQLSRLEKRVPVRPGELLDARDPERYRGEKEPIDPVAGHIPGAVNVPFKWNLTEEGRFRDPDALRAMYESMLDARDPRETAVYCGSGVTAVHNILAMEVAGLKGAALYPGSWSEWVADPEHPVVRGRA